MLAFSAINGMIHTQTTVTQLTTTINTHGPCSFKLMLKPDPRSTACNIRITSSEFFICLIVPHSPGMLPPTDSFSPALLLPPVDGRAHLQVRPTCSEREGAMRTFQMFRSFQQRAMHAKHTLTQEQPLTSTCCPVQKVEAGRLQGRECPDKVPSATIAG